MASSSKKRPRSLTPEDDEDEEEEEETHPRKYEFDLNEGPESEDDEDAQDDSDETLGLLRRWEIPGIPPEKIIHPGLIGQCSKPFRKQLRKKDVNREEQSRLGLSKPQLMTKEFLPFLGGKEWIRVSVYGPNGKIHEMKMWVDEKKNTLDFTKGWRKFVGDYDLKEICDFITIWMFWHKERREICLAIDTIRLSLTKKVSKRISKAAFDDSD